MSVEFHRLGTKIAEIRKQWGYTQKDVYALTNVSIETQRRIEHGLKEPKISTLERLSTVYKVDLIKLAINCRSRADFLSDEMIKFINKTIWQRDPLALKREVSSYLKELNHYIGQLPNDKKQEAEVLEHFMSFLQVMRDIENFEIRNKASNIINAEKLLIQLNRSDTGILSDPYIYQLEITVGLILAFLYQSNHRIEASFKVLEALEEKVANNPYQDLRGYDYMAAIKLNKTVCLQVKEDYQGMYDVICKLLEDGSHPYSRILFSDLLILKGIAMYKLGMEGYRHVCHTCLLLDRGQRKEAYLQELNLYGIDITPLN